MPLIGAPPQPITSAPLVFFVYLVLILLIGSALASVLLRNTLYGIGAFAASMVLVALLYLAIAPFLLVAVQLLVFTTVSAALLIGLLRATTGLTASGVESLYQGQKRVETPHLVIRYQPTKESTYWRT